MYLDHYCERSGEPALWAEPVNALTNLAFIMAAILAWRHIRGQAWRQYGDIYMLILILAAIGLGSGAWHVFATHTTLLMDVIPITLFIFLYLIVLLRRCFGARWWQIALAVILLQSANVLVAMVIPPDTLYGSIGYLPTYAMLVAVAIIASYQMRSFATALWLIIGMWSCSLIFRTIDIPVCHIIPTGTHCLWHIANAIVLYHCIMLVIRHCQASPQSPTTS